MCIGFWSLVWNELYFYWTYFFLSNAVIAKIGVNRTSLFIWVATVVSIIVGVLVLRENLSLSQIIGAVIIAGVYTANAKNSLFNKFKFD